MTPSSPSNTPPEPDGDGREAGRPGEWAETAMLLAKVGGIGWFVAGSIGLAALAGYWLDRVFDTSPAITLVGVVLGVVIAFRGIFVIVRALGRNGDKKQ